MIPAVAFFCLGLFAPAPAPADEATRDLVILGETRPILVRLRITVGDRPFPSAWLDSVRALHRSLDRDGDGKVTTAEADAGGLPALIAPMATPNPNLNVTTPNPRPRAEVDANPKDGVISVEELAEALREPLGPFRLAAEAVPARRTDALFDHLDRDKDGQLGRPELAAVVGSLRRLDLDDDELIAADEVAAAGPVASTSMGRPSRDLPSPPVLEMVAGESPLRLVRAVVKKFDTTSPQRPGKPDLRLSPEEIAIAPRSFEAADANHDGTLNSDELRRYLESAPRDLLIDATLPNDSSGHASVAVRGDDGGEPGGFVAQQLSDDVVEIDLGAIRLDVHVEAGAGRLESSRKAALVLFRAADGNQDGYLEPSEVASDDGQPSPLAAIFSVVDRDGDGKVFPAEVETYVETQSEVARGRLTLAAADEGRAVFGMLDLDRDRRLGAREVLDTFARLSACDRDPRRPRLARRGSPPHPAHPLAWRPDRAAGLRRRSGSGPDLGPRRQGTGLVP